MKVNFKKYSGHGNDFILLDRRIEDYNLSDNQIIKLCDRRFGIGADGIIFMSNPADKSHDFSIRIINCDASEAIMCGNAARIAVAYEASLSHKEEFIFETKNSIYNGTYKNNESIIRMSELYDVDKYDISDLGVLGGMYLNTGVPHTVIEIKNIEQMNLVAEGEKVRYDERFDGGTNVCFFEVIKKNEIKFRVYERGIEGETHCCGTGVMATAITCKKLFNWEGEILVHCLGGEVKAFVSEDLKEMIYTGKVEMCFDGVMSL